ncbi:MAG TPA: Ppx/GppA phosphatase family protein [Actinomycetota bacterium]|jgi:exopolyphosphatase/guanosine-5'-triphosphate,3'-diphosphate pyrophosphatase|nr:Ppx/GppA phosphatase family protein [Actinomycetota bacterium]
MRVAAIDVGTNSTRLLVAEERPGGFRPIDRRMKITRLGQGVDSTGRLSREALRRTLMTVADYIAACGEYGVGVVRVTGTSAVRDARNRDEFFDGVTQLTGRAPELLSGEQEARATFLGTASDLAEGPKLVVDIGGGSTELIVGDRAPERQVSLDIGCVRMFEKHLFSDPPSTEELESMRAEIRSALEGAKLEVDVSAGALLIGVAGTVTQLATLKAGVPVYDPDVTHHAVMSHGDVRLLARRLESLPYDQRSRIKGLESGRVDVIVAGAEILLAVMEVFDFAEVLVSERDILDGLVIQLFESGA